MAVLLVSMDLFALATVPAGPDEAGGPPPTKFYRRRDNATYGALRVTAELKHGRGIRVGHNAVELIMRQLGLKGLPTRRLPKGARGSKVTSLDLVCRDFRRDAPNKLWMTDMTEHPTREGKVSCCVVLDAFSALSSAGRLTPPRPQRWF
jgi:transposase InsO family protein